MKTNQEKSFARKTASVFRALAQPARIRILQAIGQGEACVCHLEAVLDLRQAYISQHLMALRDSGLVTTRRDGKYIFYRLEDSKILDLITDGAQVAGADFPKKTTAQMDNCDCPSCSTLGIETLTVLGGSGD